MQWIKICRQLLLAIFVGFLLSPKSTFAAITLKDTLSSPQLSFFARLGVGNSIGDSIIKLAVGSTLNPSNDTKNLFPNDIVGIARVGTTGLDMYTIRDIGDTAMFQIDRPIAAINTGTSLAVIATRSAIHTVSFRPESSFTSGSWRFLIKATSRGDEKPSDGIPDQEGFDLGSDVGATTIGSGTRLKAADITCPFGVAGVGGTVIISGSTYHSITCTLGLGGTNAINVGVTMTIGRDLSIGSQLINPSPSRTHGIGGTATSADIHNFYLQHLTAGGGVFDNYPGKIAVIESVRVTATIDPSITFTIDSTNVGIGGTPCGNVLLANAANTTSTVVSFGSLSLGQFNDLAQRLSCVTNARNGYVVSVYEKTALKDVNSSTTFPDTNCDGGCSLSTPAPWVTDVAHSEFGYTIQNVNVGTTIFNYNQGSGFTAKPFGIGPANAQPIMSNINTPTEIEQAYMCYRISLHNFQKAGNYQNGLVYLATATF